MHPLDGNGNVQALLRIQDDDDVRLPNSDSPWPSRRLAAVADRTEAAQAITSLCEEGLARRWQAALLPVLDNFVEAYQGNVDGVFWNSMIKRGGRQGSGGFTGYTGWFNVFFPLIQKRPNRFCVPYSSSSDYIVAGLKESWQGMFMRQEDMGAEPELHFQVQDCNNYPDGTDTVPMTWEYHGLEFPMEFVSGFVGYTQDPVTRAIMPVLSWHLLDKTPSVKLQEKDVVSSEAAVESLLSQLGGASAPSSKMCHMDRSSCGVSDPVRGKHASVSLGLAIAIAAVSFAFCLAATARSF